MRRVLFCFILDSEPTEAEPEVEGTAKIEAWRVRAVWSVGLQAETRLFIRSTTPVESILCMHAFPRKCGEILLNKCSCNNLQFVQSLPQCPAVCHIFWPRDLRWPNTKLRM